MPSDVIDRLSEFQADVDDITDRQVLIFICAFLLGWSIRVQAQIKSLEDMERKGP